MATDSPSGAYPRDKRAILGWLGGLFAVLLSGAVGFGHAKLWSQESAIATLTVQSASLQKQVDEIKAETNKKLDRLDDKLEKVLDELRKRP